MEILTAEQKTIEVQAVKAALTLLLRHGYKTDQISNINFIGVLATSPDYYTVEMYFSFLQEPFIFHFRLVDLGNVMQASENCRCKDPTKTFLSRESLIAS